MKRLNIIIFILLLGNISGYALQALVTAYNKEITLRDSINEQEENEIYVTTVIEEFIEYHRVMKNNIPHSRFEKAANSSFITLITNFYLSDKLPFDSCLAVKGGNKHIEESFREEFEEIDNEVFDREQEEALAQNPDIITVRRCDFWNEVFEFNKEIANPEGFALIERAIKEAHHALGLDWNDTIFIGKETLSQHKAAVRDIFENMREEINPVYLK